MLGSLFTSSFIILHHTPFISHWEQREGKGFVKRVTDTDKQSSRLRKFILNSLLYPSIEVFLRVLFVHLLFSSQSLSWLTVIYPQNSWLFWSSLTWCPQSVLPQYIAILILHSFLKQWQTPWWFTERTVPKVNRNSRRMKAKCGTFIPGYSQPTIYRSWAKSSPPSFLVSNILLEDGHTHSFMHCLCLS